MTTAWQEDRAEHYPHAQQILLTFDAGAANAARSLRFKEDVVALSRRFGRCLRVALYPPYTSKQHPIEHRSPRPCSREMKLRRLFQLIFVIKCSAYF